MRKEQKISTGDIKDMTRVTHTKFSGSVNNKTRNDRLKFEKD